MSKQTFRFQLISKSPTLFVITDLGNPLPNKFKERQTAVKWVFVHLDECNELQYRQGKKVYHRKDYPSGQQTTAKPAVTDSPAAGWEPAYISTHSGNYTVVVGKRTYTFGRSHKCYNELVKAIANKDLAAFEANIDTVTGIKTFLNKDGPAKIEIKDGQIIFKGEPVHHVVVDRIFMAMEKAEPYQNLVNFLENLLQNPNQESVDAVYKFLEDKSLPITPDGCFIAYKKANDNLKDWRTNTFDNSVGAKPKVDREKCDSNRINDCGYGLHCGSLHFAKDLFYQNQGVLMLVKTNPKDVVSIPSDINCEKFRTCEYEVLEMIEDYRPKPVEPEPEVKAELQGDNWDEDDEDY